MPERKDNGVMREFETGATRDTNTNKLDIEAFLSPEVLLRYSEYLNANRQQSDGSLRDGDNWQKGIPKYVYMKSMTRHFLDVWLIHRGHRNKAVVQDLQDALCALMFNTMGFLFEDLHGQPDLATVREALEERHG